MPGSDFDALVLRRMAERHRQLADRVALRVGHVERRGQEVMGWPLGRTCPIGRLAEAWVVHRYGAASAAETGTGAAGPRPAALAGRAQRAVSMYEAFAEQRPLDWPATGPAALCALASQQRAAVLAGDVARLLILAKGMCAAALEQDTARLQRARSHAAGRVSRPMGPLHFRRSDGVRWVSPEHQRQQVRDQVLLAGGNPARWPNAALARAGLALTDSPTLTGPAPCEELDGLGARAARYRADVARGRFQLPPQWRQITTPRPKEASRT